MSVSFDFVDTANRRPGFYAEFSARFATDAFLVQVQEPVVLIGQRTAAGMAPVGEALQVFDAAQAAELFGVGSMLHRMVIMAEANARYAQLWCVALDDDPAAQKAEGQVAFAGTATVNGTLSLYIGSRRVRVGVAAGDTAAEVVTKAQAAVATAAANAPTGGLAVTAAVNGTDPSRLDLTALQAGELGNGIDLAVNLDRGEVTPAGLTVTLTAMAGGTANPDIGAALAAITDFEIAHVVMPYSDAANLTAATQWAEGRWQPMDQLDALIYSAAVGSLGALTALGETLNSNLLSIIGVPGTATPSEELAAGYAATVARSLANDPARPAQTLEIAGVRAPARLDRLELDEINALLYAGVAYAEISRDERVRVGLAITTYQENAFGAPDISWLKIQTPWTMSAVRRDWRAHMAQRYPRSKLMDDGQPIPVGQDIVTPNAINLATRERSALWRDAGWIEGEVRIPVCQRSQINPGVVEMQVFVNVMNQLEQIWLRLELVL